MLRESRAQSGTRKTLPMVALLGLALCLSLWSGCKKADPLEEAAELLRTGKTDAAIAALTKIHAANPQAFDPLRLLASAAAEKKDYEGAVAWYEKVLATPEGKKLKRNFIGPMHDALMKLALQNSTFPGKYEEMLLRAAKLEEEMQMADTPANEELFGLLVRRYESAREAKRFDDAIEIAKKIGALYYDVSKTKTYTKAIARLEREKTQAAHHAFMEEVQRVFDRKLQAKLTEAGAYDAEAKAIQLSSEFTVPEKTADGLFDPESETFMQEVHVAACEGVRQQYAEVLNEWAKATAIGRELEENHVMYFFAQALDGQTPGWDPPLDPENPPATVVGLTYVCSGQLPIDFVVKGLLKVKRAFEKQAEEGAAPAEGGAAAPAAPAEGAAAPAEGAATPAE